MRQAIPRKRNLAPKEHGAYGELAFPLISGLAIGAPGLAAWAFALAAVALFWVHEPLLVLLGRRGVRAYREAATRAKRAIAIGVGFAVALGGCGLVFAPMSARLVALVPVAFAAAAAWRLSARTEKTPVGETIVAGALTGAVLPVAVASGVPIDVALQIWAGWFYGFTVCTVGVHAVKGRVRRPPPRGPIVVATLLAVGLVPAGLVWPHAALVAAPLTTAGLGAALAPVGPRRLRELGWAIIAACVLSSVLAIWPDLFDDSERDIGPQQVDLR